MPPSGFNNDQADLVGQFLRSVTGSLTVEARQRKESPREAIEREIRTIDRHFREKEISEVERSVIALVRAYYAELASDQSWSSEDFESLADKVTASIRQEVADVDVDEEMPEQV